MDAYSWIFKEIKHFLATGEQLPPPDLEERIRAVKAHLDFSIRWKGAKLGVLEMRRHYKSYFRGIEGMKPYRERFVLEPEPSGILGILEEIASNPMFHRELEFV